MRDRRRIQFAISVVLLAACLIIIFLLVTGKVRPFLVGERSMLPTLHPNDYVIALRYPPSGQGPQQGDIVILREPEPSAEAPAPDSADKKSYLVKRVIATPGDVLEIRPGGDLYINGKRVEEPYIREKPEYVVPPVEIAPNNFVVLGDNRNYSEDSVYWGSVSRERIVGKVVFIYSPLSRFGPVG